MTNRLPTDFKLDFLGKQITPSSSGKDLGVVIDSHLTYDGHIDSIVSSCMGKLCQISRVKDSFDKDTLCLMVSSLVMSKLFLLLLCLVEHFIEERQEAPSCPKLRV